MRKGGRGIAGRKSMSLGDVKRKMATKAGKGMARIVGKESIQLSVRMAKEGTEIEVRRVEDKKAH